MMELLQRQSIDPAVAGQLRGRMESVRVPPRMQQLLT